MAPEVISSGITPGRRRAQVGAAALRVIVRVRAQSSSMDIAVSELSRLLSAVQIFMPSILRELH